MRRPLPRSSRPRMAGPTQEPACGLTKVGLLLCSFEMHPFGGRLDEEVADQVTAVLSWTKREESV